MARIGNTKKYPKNTEVKKEDFIVGTQASTGKTINITVDAINKLSPSGGDNGSIKDITFRGDKLENVNKTIDLPSKLSQFENDLDPSGEGGKIDNVSFKGEDLTIVDKRVELPSKLSKFDNDLDLEIGDKNIIEKVTFKGNELEITNKEVKLPSDLSDFTDNNEIIPDVYNFVNETQVQEKIEDWSIRNVATIEELRTIKGELGQNINLLGYYSAGDKPNLLYEWIEEVGEDDGGSVIVVGSGYWKALFGDIVCVDDYGARGDNITDDSNIINKVVLKHNNISLSPKKKYIVNSTIDLKEGSHLNGNNAKLITHKSDITVVKLSSNTKVENITVVGTGYEETNSSSKGFCSEGTVDKYVENIFLNNFKVKDIQFYGVHLTFTKKVEIIDFEIEGVGYSGITGSSVSDIVVKDGLIHKITGRSERAYGIAWTRSGVSDDLSVFPRSKNCYTQNVIVKDNPNWEAFDTHAGDNIHFFNCKAVRCAHGFVITSSHLSGIQDHAPHNCSVINCSYEEGLGKGSAISIAGASHTGENSKNIIVQGNLLSGGGIKGNNNFGAIRVRGTHSIVVTNNTIRDSYEVGINIYNNNSDYFVSNNTIEDVLSDTDSTPSCIAERGGVNSGSIINNTTLRTNINKAKYVSVFGIKLLDTAEQPNKRNVTVGYNSCTNPVSTSIGQNTTYGNIVNNKGIFLNNKEPNGDIEASVGAITVDNRSSFKDATIWVKHSGVSTNTGWKALQTINSDTTSERPKPQNIGYTMFDITVNKPIWWNGSEWVSYESSTTEYKQVTFSPDYSQNQAFGEASLVKKGNEVFYKMFANKSTNVEVGDTVFTLQPELRPKAPEFIVGHGGNGAMVVWLMIEPTTGAVKVQEFPTEGSVTTMNAIVMSGSFFIRE